MTNSDPRAQSASDFRWAPAPAAMSASEPPTQPALEVSNFTPFLTLDENEVEVEKAEAKAAKAACKGAARTKRKLARQAEQHAVGTSDSSPIQQRAHATDGDAMVDDIPSQTTGSCPTSVGWPQSIARQFGHRTPTEACAPLSQAQAPQVDDMESDDGS
jgi:hypothetical protein